MQSDNLRRQFNACFLSNLNAHTFFIYLHVCVYVALILYVVLLTIILPYNFLLLSALSNSSVIIYDYYDDLNYLSPFSNNNNIKSMFKTH